jgi:meso-butanediol dehydrogenase / (S,S)-butanediol dehydrogenase / diacetyl reductase
LHFRVKSQIWSSAEHSKHAQGNSGWLAQFSGGKAVDLKGKIAIVTGGGTGIGEAVTRRFVACGARVCITGRRQGMLDGVAKSLPEGSVKTCSADVSDEKDVPRILKTALSFEGGLHVIVNNAAIDQDPPASVVDMDVAKWRRMLEVNLTGPFLMMKACIPQMIKAGSGSVVNISSLAGLRCNSDMPGFCTTKGGLINLTQQAALDYGRHNVRCNVVCPGATKTDMFTENMEAFAQMLGTNVEDVFARFMKDVPLNRVARPDEMAGICAFLASDDSSFLTGAVIPVDGGAAVVDISGAVISSIVRDLKERAGGANE